jgi:hypothetical protein
MSGGEVGFRCTCSHATGTGATVGGLEAQILPAPCALAAPADSCLLKKVESLQGSQPCQFPNLSCFLSMPANCCQTAAVRTISPRFLACADVKVGLSGMTSNMAC